MGQDSITHLDFTNFLNSGAFLRDGQQVLLLIGPFHSASEDKTSAISVSCPLYYEVEKASFLRPSHHIWVSVSDLARFCLRFIEGNKEATPSFVWQEPEKKDFETAFARIQNLIQQGQIDKAVPVVFARSTGMMSQTLKTRWLLDLLSTPEVLHPHGWWSEEEGIMGATPELLFQMEGQHLKTMALAGTLQKSQGRAEDLSRSTKDQHEHQIVVEDLNRELKNFGHVRVGKTSVVELPTLWHLKTSIELDLHEKPEIAPLVQRLHPTAALGVFPRLFGWRWMQELPGQEGRARYGAPFTVRLSEDRVISLVSIRNLQWKKDQFLIGSGCGVVKDSKLEDEWIELKGKRASIQKILGMTS